MANRKVEILHTIHHGVDKKNSAVYEAGKVYQLDAELADHFTSLKDPVSREPIARDFVPPKAKAVEQDPGKGNGKGKDDGAKDKENK